MSEARPLKALEDGNRPLKKLLAESMRDNAGLRTGSEKHLKPATIRPAMNKLMERHGLDPAPPCH